MEHDTRPDAAGEDLAAAHDAPTPPHAEHGAPHDPRAHEHVSPAEDPERVQSASPFGPGGAPPGIEREGVPDARDERDRVARAADAVDGHTQTDPVRLLRREDRS